MIQLSPPPSISVWLSRPVSFAGSASASARLARSSQRSNGAWNGGWAKTNCARSPAAAASEPVRMPERVEVPGAVPCDYTLVEAGKAQVVPGGVIDEALLSIYVNGQSLATMMCSPLQLEALAIGYLYNEGIIASASDIGHLQLNQASSVADVILRRGEAPLPRRMILTSGCGGGMTGQELSASQPALPSDFAACPELILRLMRGLQGAAKLYQAVRGVHTAALGDASGILVSAEDVGRHNAVDKVAGAALLAGIDTRERILLCSGRISSEMLGKARRMGVPIVVSRTAPTSISLALARAWRICIVGYARQSSLRVYSHPWRLSLYAP
ncbi:MAG: formate dehydrogenase accessory sulfurtransferase FdhD, partial [Chloroflexi bacterium]|nr:formate dehydrogenase accessory sulfurtransferase FdhD [Chloroflexota bacterium]